MADARTRVDRQRIKTGFLQHVTGNRGRRRWVFLEKRYRKDRSGNYLVLFAYTDETERVPVARVEISRNTFVGLHQGRGNLKGVPHQFWAIILQSKFVLFKEDNASHELDRWNQTVKDFMKLGHSFNLKLKKREGIEEDVKVTLYLTDWFLGIVNFKTLKLIHRWSWQECKRCSVEGNSLLLVFQQDLGRLNGAWKFEEEPNVLKGVESSVNEIIHLLHPTAVPPVDSVADSIPDDRPPLPVPGSDSSDSESDYEIPELPEHDEDGMDDRTMTCEELQKQINQRRQLREKKTAETITERVESLSIEEKELPIYVVVNKKKAKPPSTGNNCQKGAEQQQQCPPLPTRRSPSTLDPASPYPHYSFPSDLTPGGQGHLPDALAVPGRPPPIPSKSHSPRPPSLVSTMERPPLPKRLTPSTPSPPPPATADGEVSPPIPTRYSSLSLRPLPSQPVENRSQPICKPIPAKRNIPLPPSKEDPLPQLPPKTAALSRREVPLPPAKLVTPAAGARSQTVPIPTKTGQNNSLLHSVSYEYLGKKGDDVSHQPHRHQYSKSTGSLLEEEDFSFPYQKPLPTPPISDEDELYYSPIADAEGSEEDQHQYQNLQSWQPRNVYQNVAAEQVNVKTAPEAAHFYFNQETVGSFYNNPNLFPPAGESTHDNLPPVIVPRRPNPPLPPRTIPVTAQPVVSNLPTEFAVKSDKITDTFETMAKDGPKPIDTLDMNWSVRAELGYMLDVDSNVTVGDWRHLAQKVGLDVNEISLVETFSTQQRFSRTAVVLMHWQRLPHPPISCTRPEFIQMLKEMGREDVIEKLKTETRKAKPKGSA